MPYIRVILLELVLVHIVFLLRFNRFVWIGRLNSLEIKQPTLAPYFIKNGWAICLKLLKKNDRKDMLGHSCKLPDCLNACGKPINFLVIETFSCCLYRFLLSSPLVVNKIPALVKQVYLRPIFRSNCSWEFLSLTYTTETWDFSNYVPNLICHPQSFHVYGRIRYFRIL